MKLFISKNEDECEALKSFCEKRNWTLFAKTLIDFIPNDHIFIPSDMDWIFFGSKNAVKFVLAKIQLPKNIKIACVGKSTARAIKQAGYSVDFIGDKSGDPSKVGEEFAEILGSQKVFFPTSDISLGNVHNTIFDQQKIVEAIYSTVSKPMKIEKSELYIFTSPSNVEAFLKSNNLPAECSIISWGKSTETALLQRGHRFSEVLKDSSMEELIERLEEKFNEI